MSQQYQFLTKEDVASIRDIQKNPSKALRGITRVVRGSKTIGFFFSNAELEDLLEDLQALSSARFKARVQKARHELKQGRTVSMNDIAKRYGV